jgi:hypothetical protein
LRLGLKGSQKRGFREDPRRQLGICRADHG